MATNAALITDNFRMRWVPRCALAIATSLAACLWAACGGSESTTSSSATQPTAAAADEASENTSPPAANIEPTATPEPLSFDFDAITPVAWTEPLSQANQTLGGAADWEAEAEIAAALADAGLQMDVYVLPITGTSEWLLIMEVDDEVATVLLNNPNLSETVSQAIANSTVVRAGRVTQLAINWHSSDESGPVILTIMMPADALVGRVDGTMTDEEIQAQTLFEIVRPDQP